MLKGGGGGQTNTKPLPSPRHVAPFPSLNHGIVKAQEQVGRRDDVVEPRELEQVALGTLPVGAEDGHPSGVVRLGHEDEHVYGRRVQLIDGRSVQDYGVDAYPFARIVFLGIGSTASLARGQGTGDGGLGGVWITTPSIELS